MALDGGNGNMIMPVAPSGGFGGGGFGGDGGWWILLLFILLGGWNNGGNAYGAGGGGLYPWLNQSEQINDGFRDQMLNTTVNGIQQSITAGFGNVQNGFAQAEISANARQMADMNQTFGFQTSMLQGFNSLQGQLAQCCCDNRLATCQTQNLVQNEGAATRLAIQNQTQQILDKMCQQEMNDLFNRLCDELCEYGEKDLTQDTLKTIDTLAHAAKNVLKVMEGCEGGGSYAYYDEDPRTTAMGGSMRGNSMRGSYRMSGKRDSMGRYSREGMPREGMSHGGYSRGNNVTDGLRELMYAAPAEMQGEIQRLIKKLDNM